MVVLWNAKSPSIEKLTIWHGYLYFFSWRQYSFHEI